VNNTKVFAFYSCGLIFIYLTILCHHKAISQTDSEEGFTLFGGTGPIPVSLEADFKTFKKNRESEEYQPAKFSMQLPNAEKIELDIKIKPRGHSRRTVCAMPPILLNFPKKSNPPELKGIDKIKLVTYCQDRKNYDQYVLKEYLAYKLYNQITDYSLKVRLLEVTYKDSLDAIEPVTALGFVIEDIDDMADRLGHEEINTERINPNFLHKEHTSIMEVFQYMIGNTDWSSRIIHNIKLLGESDTLQLNTIPVAYDFDVTGFVNASYARPNPILPIQDVRTRLYRGYCRTESEFQKVFDLYLENETAIMELVSQNQYLNEKTINEASKYLQKFFEIIKDEKAIKKTIMAECRD
jgi:hypothetical protein